MKFYRDESGNLYEVDRETGDRVLIQETESETGQVSTQDETTDIQED